ncbi:MAG: hypothetical protein KatS3mg023_0165 [Armatimonadota bacterium]|nr:MAG: hypothetical protein KatS3mg023_0165 [Armatimonadota bacterium]
MHYAIAGCGKGIFEGGGTNEEKLYDRAQQWECVIVVVTEHEKRCVCSYGAWQKEDWEDHYRYRLYNNCKHFVLDVLQACLFKPPKDLPALYRLFGDGKCRALW